MNHVLLPSIASVSDFQRNYAGLLKKVKSGSQPLLVLKKNKLEVVLLSPNTYQTMVDKIESYEEKQALEAIASYEKEKKERKLKRLKKIDELFD